MIMKKQTKRPKPVVLAVLDGWGITQPYSGNAISQAETPNMKEFIGKYPSITLRASGEAVGLPWGESGNSEVGHLNLGLGRILYQDLPRINKAIGDKTFYANKALLAALEHAKKNNSKLHLLGLISNGCVHSSIEHLEALLAFTKENNFDNVFVHAIMDGRDTPFNSGINFIKEVERSFKEVGRGQLATVMGRFYAMDRDNHWDRIEKAYKAMVLGQGNQSESAEKAVEDSYANKIYDEEFVPTVVTGSQKPKALVENGDSVIFFNYRADRARQITKAFTLPGFDKFSREYLKDLYFVCFTEYEKDLPVEIAFPQDPITNTFGEILARNGLKQLRIAETEKYAHVTYFFNGGEENKKDGEDHSLVPSPQVASYDLKPEMSANEVTEKVLEAINGDQYDFILINFANADMVGHTGNIRAAIEAVKTVDKCIGRIIKALLAKDGVAFITADHGNAEVMFNMQTGMIDKEHSSNPVPLIVVGKQFEGRRLSKQDALDGDLSLVQPQGILSDVAPTILKIMNIDKPSEMSGRSLI